MIGLKALASAGTALLVLAGGGCGSSTQPAQPACSVSPGRLDFDTLVVGGMDHRTLTLSNSGGGTLAGTIRIQGAGFSLLGDSAYSLGAGASRNFTLQFSRSAPGSYAGTAQAAPGGCAPVPLAAVVTDTTASVRLVFVPARLDFGVVPLGQHSDRTVQVQNQGSVPFSGYLEPATCGAKGFSIAGARGFHLLPRTSQVFTIRAAPPDTGAAGTFSCEIQAVDSCPTGNCALLGRISLSSIRETRPYCTSFPTALAFGDVPVGDSLDKTFSVTNNQALGGGTLSGSVRGCGNFALIGDTSFVLDRGSYKQFTVRFRPAGPGPDSCMLHLTTAAGAGSVCPDLPVSGNGTGLPVCTISPDTTDFGSVAVGAHVTRTYTITNTGGGLVSGSIAAECGGFSVSPLGSYSLAHGQQRTFDVTFAPTAPGSYSCTVDLESLGGSGCPQLTVHGAAAP